HGRRHHHDAGSLPVRLRYGRRRCRARARSYQGTRSTAAIPREAGRRGDQARRRDLRTGAVREGRRSMRRRRVVGAGAIALACALLVVPLGAAAQTTAPASLTASIREISFDTDGNTNVVVAVTGSALSANQTLLSG